MECGWRSFATADMFPLAYKRHLIGMCFVPLQEQQDRVVGMICIAVDMEDKEEGHGTGG